MLDPFGTNRWHIWQDRCHWQDEVSKADLEHLAKDSEVEGKEFLFIITQEAIAEYLRLSEKQNDKSVLLGN